MNFAGRLPNSPPLPTASGGGENGMLLSAGVDIRRVSETGCLN
jgi:hypothetical protein